MKEKQKKKLVFIGASILFFGSIFLFGYYRFLRPKEVPVKQVDSLNTKLPAIVQPVRQLTKMEIYLAAEKDSLAKKEQRSRDPYVKKDTVLKYTGTSQTKHSIDQLYSKLDKVIGINQESKPYKESKTETGKVETGIMYKNSTEADLQHPLNAAASTDPELQQLSNMLDKLTELQNPSKSFKIKKIDSSVLVKAVDDKTMQAVVHQDQVVSSGGILKLRLLQDITVNNTVIPRGSFVYGVCQISNERLMVQLTSLAFHSQVLPFPLTVYDTDGIEGIYMPGAITRETGKEGADNALQSIQLNSMEAGIASQAASAGLQTAKNLFSHKLRAVRVTAKAGHRVFLQKNSSLFQ
jgi:hypothetical protein